jgi:hypothetical protein
MSSQEGDAVNHVEQLEKKVQSLSPQELAEFRAWFIEFDARVWDEQIEADLKAGKLDGLIAEALAEYKAGKAQEL